MIEKKSSNQMNVLFDNAVEKIEYIKESLEEIDKNIEMKYLIMKNEQDFSLKQIMAIKSMLTNASVIDYSNKIVFGNQTLYGKYDSYGCCIHKRMSSTPVNMFNFMTEDGPYFKNNAIVKINDTIDLDAKECLKHDNVSGKGIFFNEYDTDTIKLSITVDTGKLVGETKCNMIEILPFIAGSFEIKDISILTKESYLTGGTIPISVLSDLGETGQTRIDLGGTYNIYQIIFTIKLLFMNDKNKYPFGLRHLYFYNAAFDSDSFVIAQISKKNYIDMISDSIIISSQNGTEKASAINKNITMYQNYDNGVFTTELNFSTDEIENEFAIETDNVYVKIPISTVLYALQFLSIITR